MTEKAQPELAPPGPPSVAGDRDSLWRHVATWLVVITAFSAAFTLISNADFFWQLASGRWMLQHKSLLDFDPFSIEPEGQWVNVHWLFQLLIAFLHSLAGYEILTVLKAVVSSAVFVIFAVSLRRHAGPAWLIFSGLAMLTVMLGRLRLRPEIFSMCFIILTVSILDDARRRRHSRRLWLLTPIMLIWANMHGLYVIGLGLIWSAALGDWLDGRLKRSGAQAGLLSKRAVLPLLAGTAAVMVTPWPAETIIHPLRLWVRISGQAFHYTYGVAELRPTWQALGRHGAAVFVAGLTATAMVLNRRALPMAHAIWLIVMVTLAALAQRNVGLAGPVLGYLLAWHGQAVLTRLLQGRRRLSRWTVPIRVLLSAAACAVIVLAASSQLWRAMGSNKRFGLGLQAERYPIRAAKFLKELPGKGDVLCENFGDSSTFIYFTAPRRKLYMDGRLEAHSQQRFINQYRIANALRTAKSADKADLPETVRFVFVSHDMPEPLSALAQSRRFKLIYLDQAGACFGRTDWHVDTTKLPEPNFADWQYVLDDDAASPLASRQPTLWARNPFPANYSFGAMLLSLGQQDLIRRTPASAAQKKCILLAIRYLESARLLGEQPVQTITGTLAQAYQQRAMQIDAPATQHLPLNVNSARALYLYGQLDLADLGNPETLMYAQQQVVAMQQARQIDAASEAARAMSSRFPPPQQVTPPRSYLELLDQLDTALEFSQAQASRIDQSLPLTEQIARLISPSIGLVKLATDMLQAAAGDDPQLRLLLGDLLLSQGDSAAADQAYQAAAAAGADPNQIKLRKALLLWVTGRLFEADARLGQIVNETGSAEARYWQAMLAEQLGRSEPR